MHKDNYLASFANAFLIKDYCEDEVNWSNLCLGASYESFGMCREDC